VGTLRRDFVHDLTVHDLTLVRRLIGLRWEFLAGQWLALIVCLITRLAT
jgi:hypothetical protein